MDRKNKIWIVILAVLLALAIAAVVIINSRLSSSKASLDAVSTSLADEQQKNADLAADIEDVTAQLTESEEAKTALESSLAEAENDLDAVKTEVEALTQTNEEMQAAAQEHDAVKAEKEQLAGDYAAAQETISTLETAAQDYEERIAELESYVEEADVKIAELNQSMEAAHTQLSELGEGPADNAVNPVLAEEPEVSPSAVAAAAAPEENTAAAVASKANAAVAATAPEKAASAAVTPEATAIIAAATAPLTAEEEGQIEEICEDITALVNDSDENKTDAEKAEELNTLKTQLTDYVGKLEEVTAALTAKQTELDDAAAALTAKQTELDDAATALTAKQTELDDATAALTAMQTELDEAAADISAKQAELDEAAQTIAERDSALEESAQREAELSEKLAETSAELDSYKYARELAEGEAHSASSFADCITVDADGVTAHWAFANDALSGNETILSILVGEEEIFTSKALKPGESIDTFTLNKALEAGEIEAIAVTKVYDEDGEYVSSTSVPVKIQVA